jgi:hypothetical protein
VPHRCCARGAPARGDLKRKTNGNGAWKQRRQGRHCRTLCRVLARNQRRRHANDRQEHGRDAAREAKKCSLRAVAYGVAGYRRGWSVAAAATTPDNQQDERSGGGEGRRKARRERGAACVDEERVRKGRSSTACARRRGREGERNNDAAHCEANAGAQPKALQRARKSARVAVRRRDDEQRGGALCADACTGNLEGAQEAQAKQKPRRAALAIDSNDGIRTPSLPLLIRTHLREVNDEHVATSGAGASLLREAARVGVCKGWSGAARKACDDHDGKLVGPVAVVAGRGAKAISSICCARICVQRRLDE